MHVCPDRETAGARRCVEVGPHMEIVDPGAASSLKMHRPMKACMPPVVLILDPGRIGIPDHHDGQQIRAADEVRGEVELRRQARVFAHPDERAVAPNDRNTLGAAEVHDHVTVAPGSRHRERRAVQAGRILRGRKGRIGVGPRHHDVRVVRQIAGVLTGPAARHIDRAPALIRGRRVHPSSGRSRRRRHQAESPSAVERPTPGRTNTVSR